MKIIRIQYVIAQKKTYWPTDHLYEEKVKRNILRYMKLKTAGADQNE